MADFITLTCPNCGGKLEITPDINRFACGHCGREHIVKRSGGIVSISSVVDAIKQVSVGVGKTSAELAIVRLQKEIQKLKADRAELLRSSPRPTTSVFFVLLFLAGIILFVGGLIEQIQGSGSGVGLLFGPVMLIIAVRYLFFSHPRAAKWENTTGIEIKSLDNQIASKIAQLAHNNDVVLK